MKTATDKIINDLVNNPKLTNLELAKAYKVSSQHVSNVRKKYGIMASQEAQDLELTNRVKEIDGEKLTVPEASRALNIPERKLRRLQGKRFLRFRTIGKSYAERDDKIIELHSEGKSDYEIAVLMSIRLTKVTRIRNSLKLPANPLKHTFDEASLQAQLSPTTRKVGQALIENPKATIKEVAEKLKMRENVVRVCRWQLGYASPRSLDIENKIKDLVDSNPENMLLSEAVEKFNLAYATVKNLETSGKVKFQTVAERTEAQKEVIVELHHQKLTNLEIAEQVGFCEMTVYKHLLKNGIKTQSPILESGGIDPRKEEKIIKILQENPAITNSKLIKDLKVTGAAVARIKKDHNIPKSWEVIRDDTVKFLKENGCESMDANEICRKFGIAKSTLMKYKTQGFITYKDRVSKTSDRYDRMLELYLDGLEIEEISKETGYSTKPIKTFLMLAGVLKPARKFNNSSVRRMNSLKRMTQKGFTPERIAQKMGITVAYAKTLHRSMGIIINQEKKVG